MKKQGKDNTDSEVIKTTDIADLLVIERPTFQDERGFFHEPLRISDLKNYGISFLPVQMSHSYSKPRVIRAIHTEKWQKVIYPVTGQMFAAFVDVRIDSKTFGKVVTHIWDNTDLNSSHEAIYIPPGVGNSICVMGNTPLHYIYLVDEYWDNAKAQGIIWNDPDLAIAWPIKNPIISERDKNNPTLRDLFPDKFKGK